MADRNPATPTMLFGLPAHLVQMHPRRIEIEVEMEIDIEIEPGRDREDPRHLLVRIAVGVGAATDQVGSPPAGLDQQLFRAGIVDQTFLGKDADLEVDRPLVVVLETADRIEAAQPTRGSTSTCVRMCVVPWTIAFSSVRRPRA